MKKQSVTSKDTSINSKKLPAIYGKLAAEFLSGYVLDYGCGKYTDHIRDHVESKGYAHYLPFDPYNQTHDTNMDSKAAALAHREKTIAVCSNVLNVIDSDDAIVAALLDMAAMAATIHITVYEGDRTGKGKYTSDDSYQRNMRIKDYMPLLEKAGFRFCTYLEKGMITISCPSWRAW